jgi:carboxylesterase type B
MVYFHPGGFYGVTGHSKVFGPQYIMDHDIVLVTTNYRLGALGE